jgi:hypothetical protein
VERCYGFLSGLGCVFPLKPYPLFLNIDHRPQPREE